MIKTTLSDKIVNCLKKDLIQNLNILGILENYTDVEIYVDDGEHPRSVLVRRGYFNYIYTKEDSFIEDALNTQYKKNGFYGFSGLEESISKKLRKHFITHWESPGDLYYLPKENFDPSLKKHETKSIDITDAEKIDYYYTFRNNHSIYKIKDDIESRLSSAIYKGDEIVSWVLLHEDNSMGIMYTMEEHRGEGYAVDVTIDLADKILKQGKVPFLQINRHNNKSPGLARKCGFVMDGSAIWFGGIMGIPEELRKDADVMLSNIKANFNCEELFNSYIQSEHHQGFILSLIDMKEYHKDEKSFEVKKISSEDELKTWCETLSIAYQVKDSDFEQFNSCLYSSISNNRKNYELYLGYLEGKPASTAGIYMIEDRACSLCYLSALPEYKKEEADKLTASIVFEAKKLDDRSIIGVMSNKENSSFFKQLGGILIPPKNL
jgi:hypothetical protein